jgi:5-methylcytosine-specific restriction endonuclease McrA
VSTSIACSVKCEVCGTRDNGVATAIPNGDMARLLQICSPCIYELFVTMGGRATPPDQSPEIDVQIERKATYYGPDWGAIRERILERDGRTCQDEQHKASGQIDPGDRVVVHHRKPLREFAGNYEAANVPENLITLCTMCHGRWHAELNRQAKAAQS